MRTREIMLSRDEDAVCGIIEVRQAVCDEDAPKGFWSDGRARDLGRIEVDEVNESK